jgi:group I intron endonuclease
MANKQVCGVYCIDNLVNGKKYIGQSINVVYRFYQHRSDLKCNRHSNKHLQNAWNEYGSDNFMFYILKECTSEELDELEMFYISYFDTMNQDYGYNFEGGGNTRKVQSDETRKKISEHHADVSGENNPFFGKKHSQESIERYKTNQNYVNRKHLGEDSHFAKLTLEDATYIKKYLQDHDTTFQEEKELASEFNVSVSAIQKIKHGRTWQQIEI